MGLTLTTQARSALGQSTKEPSLVLEIDGIDRVFGASLITKYVRFGDGSDIGDPDSDPLGFSIGGMNLVVDQDNLITLDGTSTSIKQTLDPSKGQGSSISTLSIALMDDGYVSELISPGELVDDILQRQCKIYFGFVGTAWPDDYQVIFRGLITDVTSDPGKTILQLNHSDDKKRTNIFKKITKKLSVGIDASTTVLAVDSIDNVLVKIQGPNNTYDAAFGSYVRVDDEIIGYDGVQAAKTHTATVTIASPGVWTWTAHGLANGTPIVLSTTGALPTGLSAGLIYYVKNQTTNTFQLAPTYGGSVINTTGGQSGIHTVAVYALLTGVTRGALFTTAAAHAADAEANTYYTLAGNGVDLALKIMASGRLTELQGGSSMPYVIDIPFSSVNVGGAERYDNALFFKDTNVAEEYGLVAGDWLSESGGSSFIENRVRDKQVLEIIRGEAGDFVIIDNVTFTDDTSYVGNELTCAFTSQFATLPDGCLFRPDEIDVDEHLRLQRLYLSSMPYTFYIKDGIENAKDFLEQQIYMPMAAYSLPRKARASMGYHTGPIPGVDIVTFNQSNLKSASKITVKRSSNTNFFNEIVYKYDEDALEDRFNTGYIGISAVSKTRIENSPNRTLTIEARGLRSSDQGGQIAAAQSTHRLNRYQYGAEIFTFETMLDAGFAVEIGDIVILDGSSLGLPDTKNKTKGLRPRLLEIQNKDFQLKTGSIKFEAIDTNYSGAARYGLISPSSRIKVGVSTTQFSIEGSFSRRFGASEWRKWATLRNCAVKIRNSDFSVVGESVLTSVTSNNITLAEPLAFTPSAGMIMELANYDNVDVTDQVKLIYAHMRDSDFADGTAQYQML